MEVRAHRPARPNTAATVGRVPRHRPAAPLSSACVRAARGARSQRVSAAGCQPSRHVETGSCAAETGPDARNRAISLADGPSQVGAAGPSGRRRHGRRRRASTPALARPPSPQPNPLLARRCARCCRRCLLGSPQPPPPRAGRGYGDTSRDGHWQSVGQDPLFCVWAARLSVVRVSLRCETGPGLEAAGRLLLVCRPSVRWPAAPFRLRRQHEPVQPEHGRRPRAGSSRQASHSRR